jgi:hypothetical protein
MPLTESDFMSIRKMVESLIGETGEYFITGEVIKRDPNKKLVWLAEFGDQAIPVVSFDYTVKTYDTLPNGKVVVSSYDAEIKTPALGEIVVVARELGTRRLPRALGVIQGIGWITPPES